MSFGWEAGGHGCLQGTNPAEWGLGVFTRSARERKESLVSKETLLR